jgi:hypothetical protein
MLYERDGAILMSRKYDDQYNADANNVYDHH